MRILVVGGDGMLGHQLLRSLAPRHEVKVTLRRDLDAYARHGLFSTANAYDGVEARSLERLLEAVGRFRPQAIVNAVGVVKQRPLAKESIPSLELNALLPHRLALLAGSAGARLVHFSTDCVFSGRKGNYSEADTPDPVDLYGYTKLLGEVAEPRCMTLRTSLIGHELARKQSLIEWFLAQEGSVRGFRNAIFSGLTTLELARIVETLLVDHPDAEGVWHVSSAPIDKYSLLGLVKKHYGLDIEIVPDDELHCDRSLDSTRFRRRFGYQPPSWDAMIAEMSKQRSAKQ
jgi:dTDP-4-dehydrorhamnose reductase